MMEERYHATTQNRFYPDMSNVNTNITAEAKRISPPTHFVSLSRFPALFFILGNTCFLIFSREMRVAYLLSFMLHSRLYFHNKILVRIMFYVVLFYYSGEFVYVYI